MAFYSTEFHAFSFFSKQPEARYLRNFELVEIIALAQDWQIQVRKRLSGKLAGNLYKVFIAPDGIKHYSLAKARQAGFNAEDYQDGRKARHQKPKASNRKANK